MPKNQFSHTHRVVGDGVVGGKVGVRGPMTKSKDPLAMHSSPDEPSSASRETFATNLPSIQMSIEAAQPTVIHVFDAIVELGRLSRRLTMSPLSSKSNVMTVASSLLLLQISILY